MPLSQRLVDLLPLVDEVVQYVAWRHHLSADEGEDFASVVKLRLVEDDYRALRGFEGRSHPKTYLVTVVTHLLFDFRDSLWGRWRPSATAERLGPTAVLLEELITREGMSFPEAVEVMQGTHRVPLSREALRDLLHELPVRTPRLRVDEAALATSHAEGGAPDEGLALAEHLERVDRVETALKRALAKLTANDRVLMAMRYMDDLTPPQVARAIGLDVRPVYRRLGQATETVRASMLAEGITPEDIAGLLGHPTSTVDTLLKRGRWRSVQQRAVN